MKRNFFRIKIIVFSLLIYGSLYSQDVSNKGRDFWIGYGNHIRMMNGGIPEKMQLYITSDINTNGEVVISSIGFSQRFNIRANEITVIDIPRGAALLDHGLFDHGIHVTAIDPVIVYSFIYVNSISGATVCLPTNSLGNNYYSVNFDQVSNEPNAASYFFVIATDTGNTTVEITPAALTKSGQQAGEPFIITLAQGQIYQVLGAVTDLDGVDLTGSRIRTLNSGRGCKKIAVFSGSTKVAIGCAFRSSDNLYQQMYPTSTWGRKYITVPGMINSNNLFRIVKSDPTAVVKLNGNIIPDASFKNNFYYQYASDKPNVIESDKPVLVAQYFTTQGCIGNPNPGDPDMMFINPVEQTINHVTLNSLQPASGTGIDRHFFNVVVKNAPGAINTFKIDGIPFSDFIPVPSDAGHAYARITTRAGTHTITCDSGFNIIAYGFGNAESYGYSGGTHLKDLSQYASIKNEYGIVDYAATCVDAPFSFNMTFPYQPREIAWHFNGLYPDEIQPAPVADSSWMSNGRMLYQYKLNKIFKGPPAGRYPIRIVAFNPTPDGCTGIQEIDYVLQVNEKPVADFRFTSTGCSMDTIYFSDVSSPSPEPIIKWIWDFGNGDTANGKTAAYAYLKSGNYKVAFNYITDIGCVSSVTKDVGILPSPKIDFELLSPACENNDIIFSDKSVIEAGSIRSWSWTMGDGKEKQTTNASPFRARYDKKGVYTVTVQVTSDKGCVQTFAKDVQVFPEPQADFLLPSDCTADPVFTFTDLSKIEDGTEAGFSYSWIFGDRNAGGGNPDISNQKNPGHRYTAAGDYNVKLLVSSNHGCRDSTEKVFHLTAAQPKVDFQIKEGEIICSDKPVTLINQSTISFGSITNLEIYWDYNNNPSDKTIDQQATTGKAYNRSYGIFYSPAVTERKLYVVAYASPNCVSSTSKVIQLSANPEVKFDALDNICQNEPPFNLTLPRIDNGLTGSGVFSGKGISASGRFNAASAGAGNHTIKYDFTASNGCTATQDQAITVLPILVNAGADIEIEDGQGIVLSGTGQGHNISYSWSPATALDNALIAKPRATPSDDITYTLTVNTEDGCKASDAVSIRVLKVPLIPNAFSPNGDGVNDNWIIGHLHNYPAASVEVYNRYGQLVFHSTGYNKPWDGRVNGSAVPEGTYYYIINPGKGKKQYTGALLVVR